MFVRSYDVESRINSYNGSKTQLVFLLVLL